MDRSFSQLLRQLRVTNSDLELPAAHIQPYQYARLENPSVDIRLVTILPGEHADPICIEISHASLPHYYEPPANGPSLLQLRRALPSGWQAFETPEGRFVFCKAEPSGRHRSSWIHPTPDCNNLIVRREAEEQHSAATSVCHYEALSYCWGPKQNAELAFVGRNSSDQEVTAGSTDNLGIYIHQNLANALRHLRYERLPRVMWIDALCINQADESERSCQIRRMADVYRQASRVVVWLGPEGQNSDHALGKLNDFGRQIEISRDGFVIPSPQATEPDWYDPDVELPYGRHTWAAIAALTKRDWFRRLWIVQEIQLADQRRALLVCGDDSILWCHFRRCVVALLARRQGPDVAQHRALAALQSLCIGARSLSITGVIEEHFSRVCADPRDKIYGLLGVLPPDFQRRIVPHYALSSAQVYQDVLLAHLEYTDRLEFLRFCRLRSGQTESTIVPPSWVFGGGAVETHLVRFPMSQFASGYSRAAACYEAPRTLVVQGVRAATIARLSAPTGDSYQECVEAVAEWARTSLRDDSNMTPYVGGGIRGTLLDAFAITICGFVLRDRAPEVDVPSLAAWRALDWPAALLSCVGLGLGLGNGSDATAEAENTGALNPSFAARTLPTLRRRRFLTTAEGHIGLAPSEAQPGDVLAVLLGCASPMVLRRVRSKHSTEEEEEEEEEEAKTYAVVGEAFVYGLHDAQALLGTLPDGWTVQAFTDASGFTYDHRFVHRAPSMGEATVSDNDPRLPPLADGWERARRRDRTNHDPELFQCYRNTRTGVETNFDPRLDPEALKKRGVNLEMFRLI